MKNHIFWGILSCLFALAGEPGLSVAGASEPGHGLRCSTIQRLVLFRDLLSAAGGPGPLDACARPSAVGFHASTTLPIRVHYATGLSSYAAKVLADAELSWRREIEEMGFFQPSVDGRAGGSGDFDFYVQYTGGESYFCLEAEDTTTAWTDYYGFIVLSSGLGSGLRKATVAHELNHACQSATDWTEPDIIWEATSTWVEEMVYGDVNDYFTVLGDFQKEPYRTISWVTYDTYYMYGASLFPSYFSQRFGSLYPGGGGALIAEMWSRSRQENFSGEPDFLDALDQIVRELTNGSWGLEEAYMEFAEWRYFTAGRNDGRHFSEAGEWGSDTLVPMRYVLPTAALPVQGQITTLKPEAFGADYLQLTGPLPAAVEFVLTPDAASNRWGLVALVEHSGQGNVRVVRAPVGAGEGRLLVSGLTTAAQVTFIVANLGNGAFDPDSGGLQRSGYSYAIDLADPLITGIKGTFWIWLAMIFVASLASSWTWRPSPGPRSVC